MPLELTAEQRAFIDQAGTFARLATLGRDGTPQLTVMWFRRMDNEFRMVCEPNAAKARNIARDARVAIVIEHPADPYRYLQFRGFAELKPDPALGADETRELAWRYLGRERGDAYLAGVDGAALVTIVVRPERVTSFTGVNASQEAG
jgi:PPOX class probable F420-dependent enzyme